MILIALLKSKELSKLIAKNCSDYSNMLANCFRGQHNNYGILW